MSLYKGSKRCILEFISSPNFISNTNALIQHTGANISVADKWMPIGLQNDTEAELATFIHPPITPQLASGIRNWWLAHYTAKTQTPNWDLVSTCTINDVKGILLVEAKAHEEELNGESRGKPLAPDASDNSKANHLKIGNAIQQANDAMNKAGYAVAISRDKCYQLSNRIAHAWWLANQGIPVVLLYLGFIEAHDMKAQYAVFNNHQDWENCFINHARQVGVDTIINTPINCGRSSFNTIVKSI